MCPAYSFDLLSRISGGLDVIGMAIGVLARTPILEKH